MADPIVMDCGGSTRIKKIASAAGDVGDMAKLLSVGTLTAASLPPGLGPATGSQEVLNPAPTTMKIVFQDSAGVPFTIPVVPLPTNFVISSILKQNFSADFSVAGQVTISVFSTTVDPLVEAKQSKDAAGAERRRYVVANAGAIQTLSLNTTVALPAGTPFFNAKDPATSPGIPAGSPALGAAAGACIYVTVVLI